MVLHGIEKEFQVVSRDALLLVDKAREVASRIQRGDLNRFADFGHDYYPCQFEFWLGIVNDLGDLADHIEGFQRCSAQSADELGLALVGAGVNALADTAVGLNFGEHHHVGVESSSQAILFANTVRVFIPELVALSANSFFFRKKHSGYASFRLSRSQHCAFPPVLKCADEWFVRWASFGASGCGSRMMDVTPYVSAGRPTVEIRLFDVSPSAEFSVAIAMILQALRRKTRILSRSGHDRLASTEYEADLIKNRTRAIRHGAFASFDLRLRRILPGPANTSFRLAMERLLDWLSDEIGYLSRGNGHLSEILKTVYKKAIERQKAWQDQTATEFMRSNAV